MADKTTNYNLIKPLVTENYDIGVQNGNMDIIDAKIKEVADSVTNKVDKVAGKQLSTEDYTTAEKTKLGNISGSNSGDETATSIGKIINNATAKTNPADADMIGLMDSAASNILKKLSWANIKAALKTYFDTLYNNYIHPTSDGNLHVPKTGTTNNGKVLIAGSTAGSIAWGTLSASDIGAETPSGAQTKADAAAGVVQSNLETHMADIMPHQSGLNSYASSADSNGIYTVIDYKRADGTLYMKSTLSGGTSPNYTTDTWQFYDVTGTTIIATKTWTMTYDANGKITSKVVA